MGIGPRKLRPSRKIRVMRSVPSGGGGGSTMPAGSVTSAPEAVRSLTLIEPVLFAAAPEAAFRAYAGAAAAAFTARETYRVRMEDLGKPNAVPVPKAKYDRLRAEALANR